MLERQIDDQWLKNLVERYTSFCNDESCLLPGKSVVEKVAAIFSKITPSNSKARTIIQQFEIEAIIKEMVEEATTLTPQENALED